MFDNIFLKKVSQDLFTNKQKDSDPEYSRYLEHFEALQKLCDLAIWRLNSLEKLTGKDLPEHLTSSFRKKRNHGELENFFNQLDYNLDSMKLGILNQDALSILDVLRNINNQSKFHLNFMDHYAKFKLKEMENLKKIENPKELPDIIEYSDQDALYKSKPKISMLDQLIQSVDYTSNNVLNSATKLQERRLDENQKERFNILQKVNNVANSFKNSVDSLYKYTIDNKIKLGKRTWKAKNVVGLIRSVVSEEEYIMYLNNLNQAAKTLYLIE